MPEILAPAGSMDALTAAVRCGANAVYLGIGEFNARRNAQNFTTATLREAVVTCHARNVKVYIALNTLVREEEMAQAMETVRLACELGIDALIVQDMGLARRIRSAAPHMRLHASTQLSCHTPAGVKELAACGFSRVVLSREMSREEIAACANFGCELEVFVHGALCMCVSGQCYFSAMLGGRSGNRGLCAQTCRLPFQPDKGCDTRCTGHQVNPYSLSLKDVSLLDYVQDMAAIGVNSLKIEGRMKRPEYVAAATSAVYEAVHAVPPAKPNEQRLNELQSVFSRSGFTDGYYAGSRTPDMFGIRRKEDVVAAGPVFSRLQRLYDREMPLVGVTMSLSVQIGKPTQLTITDENGNLVTVTGQAAEPAVNRPLDKQRVQDQLNKTGGTPFMVRSTEMELDENGSLPLSALNALRREGLDALMKKRESIASIPFDNRFPAAPPSAALPWSSTNRPARLVRLADSKAYTTDMDADMLILPLAVLCQEESLPSVPLCAEIPRGMFGIESRVQEKLRLCAQKGVRFALCSNVGAIPLAKEAGLIPIGGFGLNITNRLAVDEYAAHGLQAATISFELTFSQMKPLTANSSLPLGILAYGRQPLMLTRNCPLMQGAVCRKPSCHQALTDRKGIRFPLACDGNCVEILNSAPLYLGDIQGEFPALDFLLFYFTTESPQEITAVMQMYRQGRKLTDGFTRGLYRRGVE